MRKFSKKQYLTAGAAAAVIIAGSGAAYAYWTTTGTGTGTAAVGTDAGFTVGVTGPSNLVLDQAQNVGVSVMNKATFKQQLNSIAITVTGTKDGSGNDISASCLPSWFTVVNPTVSTHEVNGSATENYTGTITLNDNSSNQNSCKGATVELSATAS